MASAISASVTVSVSSITAWQMGKVTDPGSTAPAEPSDRVGCSGTSMIRPASSERSMLTLFSGHTPTIRVFGLNRFMTVPVPPIRPPQPVQMKTASNPVSWSISSAPSVPWPATTSRSL